MAEEGHIRCWCWCWCWCRGSGLQHELDRGASSDATVADDELVSEATPREEEDLTGCGEGVGALLSGDRSLEVADGGTRGNLAKDAM